MHAGRPTFDETSKTIYTVFDETVRRICWMQIISDVHQQAKQYPDTIHIIHDFRTVQYRMMPTSLRHALQLAKDVPENVGTYIILTNNRLIEFVGQTVINLMPHTQHKIAFTTTREAADQIISRFGQSQE
ncbi:MAG: hypothetical protein KC496_06235 [Anaerolineae bacterium]|nr:hypothetical protein [Anaerolineae bacterium]